MILNRWRQARMNETLVWILAGGFLMSVIAMAGAMLLMAASPLSRPA
jgi:hypothetical protein